MKVVFGSCLSATVGSFSVCEGVDGEGGGAKLADQLIKADTTSLARGPTLVIVEISYWPLQRADIPAIWRHGCIRAVIVIAKN